MVPQARRSRQKSGSTAGHGPDTAIPAAQQKTPREAGARRGAFFRMEAEVGIEPAYADLQSAA